MSHVLLRSILFIPANKPKYADNVLTKRPRPDAIVIDLEDSIPPNEKEVARSLVGDLVGKLHAIYPTFIRVNGVDTKWFIDDVNAASIPGVAGLMIPKATQEAIRDVDRLVLSIERDSSLTPNGLKLIPIIETAAGVVSSYEVAISSPRIIALSFGIVDYSTDLGLAHPRRGPLTAQYARMKIANDAAAAGVVAIDSIYENFRDLDGFRRDCLLSRELGFRGRLVIHPSQVDITNDIYSPSEEEVRWAEDIVGAYEEATSRGLGAASVGGTMIDSAHYKIAKRILSEVEDIRARDLS